MPTTADYQCELQGLLMGAGTIYDNAEQGPKGVASVPPQKTADVDLGADHGVVIGGNYGGARLIEWPIVIANPGDDHTAEDLGEAIPALLAAWTGPDDPMELVTIEIQLPGRHFTAEGRPLGLDELSIVHYKSGVGEWVGEFFVPDGVLTPVA